MKKLVFSLSLFIAMSAFSGVMAQEKKAEGCCKPKTECPKKKECCSKDKKECTKKAECKKECAKKSETKK